MTGREVARAVINQISSQDIYTRYSVREGKLYIEASGGLSPELVALVQSHKQELIDYLGTPPAIAGDCPRGHARTWAITPYGDWVCSCYFAPPDLARYAPPAQESQEPQEPIQFSDYTEKKYKKIGASLPARPYSINKVSKGLTRNG